VQYSSQNIRNPDGIEIVVDSFVVVVVASKFDDELFLLRDSIAVFEVVTDLRPEELVVVVVEEVDVQSKAKVWLPVEAVSRVVNRIR
jgi:hypothetical protein